MHLARSSGCERTNRNGMCDGLSIQSSASRAPRALRFGCDQMREGERAALALLAAPPLHKTCITSPADVTGVTHSSALCLVLSDHVFRFGVDTAADVSAYEIVIWISIPVVMMITIVKIAAVLLLLVIAVLVVLFKDSCLQQDSCR